MKSVRLAYAALFVFAYQFAVGELGAAVYQYTDKSGKTHYSDKPFTFKQSTLGQEQKSRRLRPGWQKSNTKLLLGKWLLYATASTKNAKMVREQETWWFNSDGSYFVGTSAEAESATVNYFFNGAAIEIGIVGQREIYKVVDLTQENLVLRAEHNGRYHYLRRSHLVSPRQKSRSYYAREEVVTIVSLITCGKIDRDASSQLDIDRLQTSV